jgi:hypothetical protein
VTVTQISGLIFSKRIMIITIAAQKHQWIRCQTPWISVSCHADPKFDQTERPDYVRLVASFSEVLASFRALLCVLLTTLLGFNLNDSSVNI